MRDSYVSYEAIVMLNDKAVVGTNYSFNAIMKMADGAVDKDTNPLVLDLSTADIAAEKVSHCLTLLYYQEAFEHLV